MAMGLWASLPFPSTHATVRGMGASHCSVMWVCSSSLMSFVVVLCDVGEWSQWQRNRGGAYLPFASAHTSIRGMHWPSFVDMGMQILVEVIHGGAA